MRIKLSATHRRSHPVELDKMPQYERECDHARGTLQRVTHVANIGIGTDVRQPPGDDYKTNRGMKNHR